MNYKLVKRFFMFPKIEMKRKKALFIMYVALHKSLADYWKTHLSHWFFILK